MDGDIGAVPDLPPSDTGTERTYKDMLNSKVYTPKKKKFRSIDQLRTHIIKIRGIK